MTNSITQSPQFVFYTIGFPGAGKTTFATNLAAQLQLAHLSADDLSFKLFGIPRYTPEEAKKLYSALDQQLLALVNQGKSVIYDASVNTHRKQRHLVSMLENQGVTIIGIWLILSEDLALSRSAELRSSPYDDRVARMVPPDVFWAKVAEFEVPLSGSTVIKLSGTDQFATQFKSFRKALRQRGYDAAAMHPN